MHPEDKAAPIAPSPLRTNLERLLATGRDGALLRFGLGQALLREDLPALAETHLREATRQDPDYSAAWKLLGKALERLGQAEQAEAAWRQGLLAAERRGDLQSIKEITVFLRRLERTRLAELPPAER